MRLYDMFKVKSKSDGGARRKQKGAPVLSGPSLREAFPEGWK